MPAPESAAAADSRCQRSASAIVGATVSGQHLLHIDGYSRTKEDLPTGKSIESRPFIAGGRTWRVRYYPNGMSSAYAEFISVFFILDEGAAAPVKARGKFTLLDPAGKPVQGYTENVNLSEYSNVGSGYGIADYVKREWLEKSEYLFDDSFSISCEVIVCKELHTEDRIAPGSFVAVPPSDLNHHLGNLLKAMNGADIAFRVAGETFKAHRFLLAVRSPVFKAQLMGGMKEGTATGDCIQIDDMLPQVFKALLHFVYTDSLPEMEGQEGIVMAQHLLEAADRYDMQRLKLICEDKLCRHLDSSTAATTLVLAEQHRCQGLKEACIEFLKSPDALEAVIATDGFEHLTKSSPVLVKELMSMLSTRLHKRRKPTT